MASEIQTRLQMAKANIEDDGDTRSIMSDMIKEDKSETDSIRSVSTTSSRRFRILPNPKKMIQRAFGGGMRGTGEHSDLSDKRSVQSSGSASIFSKFKMKDLHKDQDMDHVETHEYDQYSVNPVETSLRDHNSTSHSPQPSIIINDLNEKRTGHIVDRDVDNKHQHSYENDGNVTVNEKWGEVENINVARKDSNESIMSTMSTWSNFGFHIFGSVDDNHHASEPHIHSKIQNQAVANEVGHEKVQTTEQPEADLDLHEEKSTISNSSQKSKFSSSSFGKMKKKMVRFFLKNSNGAASVGGSNNSDSAVLSTSNVSQLEQYHNQQEEMIKTLMGLGFDRQSATTALIDSRNNVDVAANRLLAELEHSNSRASVRPTLTTVSEDSEYLRPRNGPPSW